MSSDGTPRGAQLRQVFLYFGPLTLLIYWVEPTGQLLDIASAYMLKNQLHATAAQVATFRLVTAIPVYLAFVFGVMRDRFDPFGMRDRGFFLIFATLTAGAFAWLAWSPLTYGGLLVGMLMVMLAFRFVAAAHQGLLALVAQEKMMSGRLSALWVIVSYVPLIAGSVGAGYLAENVSPKRTFELMTVLALLIAALGFWKPKAVFGRAYDQPPARGVSFGESLKRLLGHRAIYAPVLLMLMFQFSPGQGTVLQYYLSNELHASDAVYGLWNGIFLASFVPIFLLYGRLCKTQPLRKLLWWGTIVCVPQLLPLAFVHSAVAALWLAIPIGMMGGIIWPAIYDLAMRSCPPGLQGTLMMMVAGVNALAVRGSDVLGTRIYAASPAHGFLVCALVTTLMYALMLPILLLIPKSVIATTDGETGATAA